MTQHRSASYSQVNLNFRVTGEHAHMVHEAAASRQESAAQFMRTFILEWSAMVLGKPAPDLSEYSGDIIATAAKKLGMTPKEFADRAAKEAAARALHDPKVEVGRLSEELQARLAQPHESGERKLAAGAVRRR